MRDQFAQITKKTFKQFINDKVNDRLNIALASESSVSKDEPKDVSAAHAGADNGEKGNKTVTTDEELEGYYIIKTLLRESIDANRINIRDALSYCSVLLDDNSRKPIARMYFNGPNKQLGLFDSQTREEQKVSIETPDDIYKYSNT